MYSIFCSTAPKWISLISIRFSTILSSMKNSIQNPLKPRQSMRIDRINRSKNCMPHINMHRHQHQYRLQRQRHYHQQRMRRLCQRFRSACPRPISSKYQTFSTGRIKQMNSIDSIDFTENVLKLLNPYFICSFFVSLSVSMNT